MWLGGGVLHLYYCKSNRASKMKWFSCRNEVPFNEYCKIIQILCFWTITKMCRFITSPTSPFYTSSLQGYGSKEAPSIPLGRQHTCIFRRYADCWNHKFTGSFYFVNVRLKETEAVRFFFTRPFRLWYIKCLWEKERERAFIFFRYFSIVPFPDQLGKIYNLLRYQCFSADDNRDKERNISTKSAEWYT